MKTKSIISEKWRSSRCEALGILRVDPFEVCPELIHTELKIKRLKAGMRRFFGFEWWHPPELDRAGSPYLSRC